MNPPAQLFVSGQPDVDGVHVLIRFAVLLIVFAAIVWKLRESRRCFERRQESRRCFERRQESRR